MAAFFVTFQTSFYGTKTNTKSERHERKQQINITTYKTHTTQNERSLREIRCGVDSVFEIEKRSMELTTVSSPSIDLKCSYSMSLQFVWWSTMICFATNLLAVAVFVIAAHSIHWHEKLTSPADLCIQISSYFNILIIFCIHYSYWDCFLLSIFARVYKHSSQYNAFRSAIKQKQQQQQQQKCCFSIFCKIFVSIWPCSFDSKMRLFHFFDK